MKTEAVSACLNKSSSQLIRAFQFDCKVRLTIVRSPDQIRVNHEPFERKSESLKGTKGSLTPQRGVRVRVQIEDVRRSKVWVQRSTLISRMGVVRSK